MAKGPGMVRRTVVRLTVPIALCALVTTLLAPAPTAAADQPTTVAGLLSYFYDLSAEAERVNEELLGIQEELATARQVSATAADRATAASVAADEAHNRARQAREDLDRVNALLAGRRGLGTFSALMTSADHDDLLIKMEAESLAAQITGNGAEYGNAALAEADRAADEADKAGEAARSAEATVSTGVQEVEQRRGELDKQINEVRATLDRLTPDQRALLAEIEDPGDDVAIPPGDVGGIVRFALAQVGKPYLWGAVGPDSYDCSGLMLTAFRAGGIALPRVSIQQSGVGQQISRAEVRAGDLVFYYQPVHHVAMAVDNYRAVHAPTFGQNVKLSPIDQIGPLTVIRRVVR